MRVRFGLLVGMLLAASAGAAAQDPTKVPPELAKARLDAARKTYEMKWRRIRGGGGGDPESLYAWSRRWRDAQVALEADKEGRLAAFRAHLNRMEQTAKLFAAHAKAGQGRQEDAEAAEYCRIQAAIDLARIKGH